MDLSITALIGFFNKNIRYDDNKLIKTIVIQGFYTYSATKGLKIVANLAAILVIAKTPDLNKGGKYWLLAK